jgi:hypothetical protein
LDGSESQTAARWAHVQLLSKYIVQRNSKNPICQEQRLGPSAPSRQVLKSTKELLEPIRAEWREER